MIDQRFLKIGTGVGLVSLVGLIAWAAVSDQRGEPVRVSEVNSSGASLTNTPTLEMGQFGVPRRRYGTDKEATGKDELSSPDGQSSLRVGRIGAVPERSDITRIDSLPATENAVLTLYRQAKGRACRIVVQGSPVSRSVSLAREGVSGTVGRVPALTIGLELDERGRDKLPAVVRGQVIKYFREHRLSVQPIVYHDERGAVYFGTDCQAAFFALDRPGLTLQPESMIETAVGRFRAIGVVGKSSSDVSNINGQSGSQGRTLAMAFTFDRDSNLVSGLASDNKNATEWLLLHLPPDATVNDLGLQVFVTKNDRSEVHLLDTADTSPSSPMPTISASVRFDKMTMLGMYPAEPVVSAMRFRSVAVLPMSVVRRLTTSASDSPGQSLTDVLDQFGELKSREPSPRDSLSEDEQWLERIREQKNQQLEELTRDRNIGDDAGDPSTRRSTKFMSGLAR